MPLWSDPHFGQTMITLMTAAVLVLQITLVAQKSLVASIRVFGVQSLLLAGIAGTIAWFTGAGHIYVAAALTLLLKSLLLPAILLRLVEKIQIEHELKPLLNVPISVLISVLLTLLAYVVAEPLQHGMSYGGPAEVGHNTLPLAVALFLTGFFLMANRARRFRRSWPCFRWKTAFFWRRFRLPTGCP